MTAIKGTNLAAPVVPFDTADTYPTHDPVYGIGGWREVADSTARDAIPTDRRRQGMVVVTQSDGNMWQLSSDLVTWVPFTTGGGSGRYDMGIYYPAKPVDGQVIFLLEMVADVRFPASLTGSKFTIGTVGTNNTTFTFNKNGTPFGTVTFPTTGSPTLTGFSSNTDFAAGDILTIVNQSPADATAANPSFTLALTLLA